MGYALLREKAPLGQKVEDLGLRLENVALSHCCVRGKCAANDKLASGAVLPGQYFDAETNLHYNHHRYYDPELGRYITSDPIGLGGGKNTYSYALSNPLFYVDPDGRIGLVGGVFGAVVNIGLQLSANGGNVRGIVIQEVVLSAITGAILPGVGAAIFNSSLRAGAAAGVTVRGLNSILGEGGPTPPVTVGNIFPPSNDSADTSSDGSSADFGSLDPVSDALRRQFCQQNPGAPNCQPQGGGCD